MMGFATKGEIDRPIDEESQNKLISVIIPAYNAEATIFLAIESVLCQTIQDLEIIVWDDASHDCIEAVVNSFLDARISYYRSEDNLGPGLSRDLAIEKAAGRWIALLDADDAWEPQRLARMLKAGQSLNADLVFDNTMLSHDVGNRIIPWKALYKKGAFGGGVSPRSVRAEDYIRAPRLLMHPLIRRDAIQKYQIRHSQKRFAEDAEFYLRIAHCGMRFVYVPEPLYLYRISPGSLTAQSGDPTLMRRCLEECAQWDNWSLSVAEAFEEKIEALHENEAMYTVVSQLQRGRLGRAFATIYSYPSLLKTVLMKALEKIQYHIHRLVHGGARR